MQMANASMEEKEKTRKGMLGAGTRDGPIF